MTQRVRDRKAKLSQIKFLATQTSELRSEDLEILILGIDLGTTGVKVAYIPAIERVDDEGKRYIVVHPDYRSTTLTGWPGERLHNLSAVPTPLLYDADGRLIEWGNNAVHFLEKSTFSPNYMHHVVTNWKMGLHNSGLSGNLRKTAERLGKKPDAFIEDFCRALAKYLIEDEHSNLREAFQCSDFSDLGFAYIDIALALPPGWRQHEHGIIRRAATKGFSSIPNLRLTTVSETECALRGWMSQSGRRIVKNGDVVMLVDLGGLTGCISAFWYEVCMENGGRWTHIESHSLLAGSELAGEEFEHFYKSRRKEAELPASSEDVRKARQAFDSYKMAIGEENEEEEWVCPVKGLEQDDLRRFIPDGMIFSRNELRLFFEPSQDMIVNKMEEVTSRLACSDEKPKYCVFAGAYARNRLFKSKLRQINSKMGMEPIWPQNLPELVATGACLARVDGDFRQLSGSRYSVGILILIDWEKVPEAHRENAFKFQYPGDKNWWVRGIAWVIKKGDHIKPGQIIGPDNTKMRKRYPEGKMQFEETVYITEGHPGESRYTFLRYSTINATSMKRNYSFLREVHSLDVNPTSYTVDLAMLKRPDGSPALTKMMSKHLKLDKVGRFFEYGYYFETTQTDCRVWMEVILAKYKCQRIELQVSIEDIRDTAAESIELQEEYAQFKVADSAIVAIAATEEPCVEGEIDVGLSATEIASGHRLKRLTAITTPNGELRARRGYDNNWQVPVSPSWDSDADGHSGTKVVDFSASIQHKGQKRAIESLRPITNGHQGRLHHPPSIHSKQSQQQGIVNQHQADAINLTLYHTKHPRQKRPKVSSADMRSATMAVSNLINASVDNPDIRQVLREDEEQEEAANIELFQGILDSDDTVLSQITSNLGTSDVTSTDHWPSEPSPEEIRRVWSYEHRQRI